jgi:hypothetical protein
MVTNACISASFILIILSYIKVSRKKEGFEEGGSKPGTKCSPNMKCHTGLRCNPTTMMCESL